MTPASRQFGRGQRSRGMKQQRSRSSQSDDPANQQENTDNWWKAEQQPCHYVKPAKPKLRESQLWRAL